MGGRQSSQNSARHRSPSEGTSRFSAGSLDNGGGDLLSGLSGGLDLTTERPISRRRRRRDRNDQFIEAHSLPAHLFPFVTAEIKCPVCNKRIGTNEIETHLLECLAKPRVSYNEDVLKSDSGECIICFEDMITGEHIARLPCLCIYHKKCLDEWFARNRCCPAHPDQVPQEYTDNNSGEPSTSQTDDDNTQNTSDLNAEDNSTSNVEVLSNNSASHVGDFSNNSNFTPVETDLLTEGASAQTNNPIIPQIDLQHEGGQSDWQRIGNEPNNSYEELGIEPQQAQTEPETTPDAILPADDCECGPSFRDSRHSINRRHTPRESDRLPIGKTIVHVDEGSMHGSPGMFDDDEIEQLASKIKTILVQESPRSRDYEGT